ncbi:MAG: ATP-binding cassette domain-containing protein [Aeromicrobium sp.]|uniref:ABC transporter ATP-binding protein/permease n=1 Tax=Aeromicrobium sp. TaxID=1871063 RepID=UPI0039E2269E
MSRGFSGALMRASGVGEWTFEVLSVEDLTPHYRRLRVHAPGFFGAHGQADNQVDLGPASYVRLWAPDIEDPRKEHQRGYTVVDPDPETEQMTLDFVLHEPAGPASAWAQAAEVGSTINATRFGVQSFSPPAQEPAGYLLVGDLASLPAVNAIIASLPVDVPIEAFLEYVHDDDLTLPITEHPELTVTWVRRKDDSTAPRDALAATGSTWPGWYAVVAGEKTAVKHVRAHLKEIGFPNSARKAQAYWASGQEMGKSRTEEDAAERPEVETVTTKAPQRADDAPQEPAAPAGQWAAAARRDLLAPVWPKLKIAAVLQVLVSLLTLAPYVVLTEVCRRVLDGTDDIAELAWWALGLMGAGSALSLALIVWLHVVDADFGHHVRTRMVDRLGRLPLGWFDDRNSGQVRKAVQDDAGGLHYLVTHAVLDLVAAIVTPLAVLVYLFTVHAGLAAVLLLPLFVYYVLALRMFAIAGDGLPTFERFREQVSGEVVAFVDGAEVARVYDLGPEGRLRTLLDDRARFVNAWQGPLVGLKTAVDIATRPTTYLLLILGAGGLMMSAGWLNAAHLVAFLLVGVTFGSRLMAIGYGLSALKEGSDAAGRVGLLLAEPVLDDSRLEEGRTPDGTRVRFEDVTFSYRPGHPVLRDVDLALEPGTITAIVGPSGAGKSTLATLLARFDDVDSGRVTIGGVDVRAMSQQDLYGLVGFVFQNPTALRASVHDNIALGRPDATRAEVEDAAKKAQLHERIVRDPRGYDAVLGEQTWLSGGELQRLSIARTLLADPPILVLDEATASADPESEDAIQRAIASLVGDGRTVLVIAHRLHTITGVDRILVLDEGRVVQDGPHATLVEQPGRYADLWAAFNGEQVTA